MKKITREILAKEVVRKWRASYGSGRYGDDKLAMLRKLESLKTPDPDKIDEIIGNTSWTSVGHCHECGKEYLPVLIQLGEEPNYESATAKICLDCLKRALDLANE